MGMYTMDQRREMAELNDELRVVTELFLAAAPGSSERQALDDQTDELSARWVDLALDFA